MSFLNLKLSNVVLKVVEKNGYKKPTAIQKVAIPLILEKRDIIAKAQTGSGKTAAFVIPILEYYLKNKQKGKSKIRTLVLTPTRELALQVSSVFSSFSSTFLDKLNIVTLIGGETISKQLLDVQKSCDIVVATPGRLIDIYKKNQINLDKLEFFVIDEADKMLNLGFKEEIDFIINKLPSKRQNLLFSATYGEKIEELSLKISKDFSFLELENESENVKNINQRAILVNKDNRGALLRTILKNESWKKVLIFMANNRAADNIAIKFKKYGFKAQSFHGNLNQDERNLTLEEFKNGEVEFLFSSDLSARGLHIDDIESVINFDLPRSTSDYIHRIGRTGRVNKSGTSISFITEENFEHFNLIQKRCKIELKKEQIEGFEFIGELSNKNRGKAPIKGKRKSKKDRLRESSK